MIHSPDQQLQLIVDSPNISVFVKSAKSVLLRRERERADAITRELALKNGGHDGWRQHDVRRAGLPFLPSQQKNDGNKLKFFGEKSSDTGRQLSGPTARRASSISSVEKKSLEIPLVSASPPAPARAPPHVSSIPSQPGAGARAFPASTRRRPPAAAAAIAPDVSRAGEALPRATEGRQPPAARPRHRTTGKGHLREFDRFRRLVSEILVLFCQVFFRFRSSCNQFEILDLV